MNVSDEYVWYSISVELYLIGCL